MAELERLTEPVKKAIGRNLDMWSAESRMEKARRAAKHRRRRAGLLSCTIVQTELPRGDAGLHKGQRSGASGPF